MSASKLWRLWAKPCPIYLVNSTPRRPASNYVTSIPQGQLALLEVSTGDRSLAVPWRERRSSQSFHPNTPRKTWTHRDRRWMPLAVHLVASRCQVRYPRRTVRRRKPGFQPLTSTPSSHQPRPTTANPRSQDSKPTVGCSWRHMYPQTLGALAKQLWAYIYFCK